MNQQPFADYLMWVGAIYYPQVNDFIDEANKRGVCKRLGHLPGGLVPGKSKIFLAHDDGVEGEGFIFGYFTPTRIEYLTHDEMEIPASLYDIVHWVDEWEDEEERECGYRREGMYAVADIGVIGSFFFFSVPRSLEAFDPDRGHFRGLLQIAYGPELMKKPKTHQQFVPPSWKKPVAKKISDDKLVTYIESASSISKGAQLLAYALGQPKSAILYRYRLLTGRIKPNVLTDPDPEEIAAEALERKIENRRLKSGKSYIGDEKKVLRKGNVKFFKEL